MEIETIIGLVRECCTDVDEAKLRELLTAYAAGLHDAIVLPMEPGMPKLLGAASWGLWSWKAPPATGGTLAEIYNESERPDNYADGYGVIESGKQD